jgi:outer membrane lipoprotein SlyB
MSATLTMGNPAPQLQSNAGNFESGPAKMLPATRPLWAAVGVLGVCVLAMGATIIHINQRPAEPTAQAFMPNLSALAPEVPDTAVRNGVITEMASDKYDAKSTVTQVIPAQAAAKSIANQVSKPLPAKTTAATKAPVAVAQNGPATTPNTSATPAPAATAPVKAVCASCGTVEAVTPITREGKGSGVGIVAGGVLGAVVGNQIGAGNGRTAATVLGAVGGGWAGNKIEKNIKKDTVYAVRVRMEDGSVTTKELGTAPAVGAPVTVDGGSLRVSDGRVFDPAPVQRARAAPATVSQSGGPVDSSNR